MRKRQMPESIGMESINSGLIKDDVWAKGHYLWKHKVERGEVFVISRPGG